MTTLTDPMLAEVTRKGGFVWPDLSTAIACAMATSGGIPAYTHAVWPGPVARYEGLWGLDTVQWPRYATRDLTNPYTAARAAHELTEKTGDFGWCPVYRTGIWRHYADRATVAGGLLPGREPIIEHTMIDTHATIVRQAADRLAHRYNRLATRPTRSP